MWPQTQRSLSKGWLREQVSTFQGHQACAFVVEDIQAIATQTFPTIPEAHSCENILLYRTYQLIIFRGEKLCDHLLLFSHSCFSFPRNRKKPRGALGRGGQSGAENLQCAQTKEEQLGRWKRTSRGITRYQCDTPTVKAQRQEYLLNRSTSDFIMKLTHLRERDRQTG